MSRNSTPGYLKKFNQCIYSILMILCIELSPFNTNAQNLTGNPWLSWVPELNSGVETPRAAFGVNAVNNQLQNTVNNTCRSYGIGNDKRGYIYYADNTNALVRCVNPFSKTVISSFGFSSGGASIVAPHAFQSFYDLASNKHYLAISNVGQDINTVGAITILDVTDPAAITFVKNILIPAAVGTGTRCPGMDIYQSAYTSAGTTIYVAVDNGHIPSDLTAGLFLKIIDPLNATPTITGYAARYDATYKNNYVHAIQVDNTNERVYVSGGNVAVSGQNQATVLSFNTVDGTPTNNVYIGIDADGTGSGGFHTIAFDRTGGVFYVGSQYDGGGDRAYKFTVQANAGSPATVNYTAQSPVLGSGATTATVKGVNLLPDASKLYAVLETDGTWFTPNSARILELNQTTLAINATVQNKAGTGPAQFGWLDPHSYAFTLHDFGDAPASYGIAAHFLSNEDYLQDRLRIGATIDGDSAIVYSANLDGDNTRITPRINDEDGITSAMTSSAPGLYYGMTGTYLITGIVVRNVTVPSVTANLIGWIDFNHDGIFQSTEAVSVSVPNGAASVNLNWTIPANVSTGPVLLRLRLSSDPSLTVSTPSTTVFDGEAEDHKFPLPVTVSGSVFADGNGNTIFGTGGIPGTGENGTSAGVSLYAYMIIGGIIIDSAHVSATGVYIFQNAPQNAGPATIVIGANNLAPGSVSSGIINIAAAPPTGWVYTGSSSGGTSNGNADALGITLGTTGITNQNFGIDELPVADPKTQSVPHPTGGVIAAGSVTTAVSGTDGEDGTLGNSNTIVIATVPAGGTIMYYDFGSGPVAIAAGQTITGFNPAMLSFNGIPNGSTQVVFNYAFIDAANKQGTAASYTLNWPIALPVKLENFTVKASACNKVDLEWKIAEAVDFSHFEIERSINGVSFQTTAIILYSATSVLYNVKQSNQPAGQYQYRLKMVDADGEFVYSPILVVRLNCNQDKVITVYPNPAKEKVTINGLKGGDQIIMCNAAGQMVYSGKTTDYQLSIDMTTFATGAYYFRITGKNGEKISGMKIVKIN